MNEGTTPLSDSIESRRQRAIAYLGNRWIAHPQYQAQPRHALKGWEQHSVLHPIVSSARIGGRV